MDKNMTMAQR